MNRGTDGRRERAAPEPDRPGRACRARAAAHPGLIGGRVVFDTRRALYVWEWRAYPQFSIPVEDMVEGVLTDDEFQAQKTKLLAT